MKISLQRQHGVSKIKQIAYTKSEQIVYSIDRDNNVWLGSSSELVKVDDTTIIKRGSEVSVVKLWLEQANEDGNVIKGDIDQLLNKFGWFKGEVVSPAFYIDKQVVRVVKYKHFNENDEIPIIPDSIYNGLNGNIVVSNDGFITGIMYDDKFVYINAGVEKTVFNDICELFAGDDK